MAVSAENLTLSIVRETTPGTTPATPAFIETHIVSESLAANPSYVESQMIIGGTRGMLSNVLTAMATAGDLNRELVYEDSTNLILQSLFGNDWVGDALSDSTILVPLTIEKKWDVAGSDQYHEYRGNVAASGTISFAPGEIANQNTSFVGLSYEIAAAMIVGATYTPPVGNPPMAAPKVTSMNLCTVGTRTPVSWMGTACFTNMTLNFDNATRALACIGSIQAREIALGRLNLTATGSLYYAADDPLESLLDETEYALEIVAVDPVGNEYDFYMPRVKFTAATVLAAGVSTDVMTEFTLQCLQDTTLDYSILLTKTDAP